ncbi:hypothetical protein A3Q56_07612, partial [Intoshia linei]
SNKAEGRPNENINNKGQTNTYDEEYRDYINRVVSPRTTYTPKREKGTTQRPPTKGCDCLDGAKGSLGKQGKPGSIGSKGEKGEKGSIVSINWIHFILIYRMKLQKMEKRIGTPIINFVGEICIVFKYMYQTLEDNIASVNKIGINKSKLMNLSKTGNNWNFVNIDANISNEEIVIFAEIKSKIDIFYFTNFVIYQKNCKDGELMEGVVNVIFIANCDCQKSRGDPNSHNGFQKRGWFPDFQISNVRRSTVLFFISKTFLVMRTIDDQNKSLRTDSLLFYCSFEKNNCEMTQKSNQLSHWVRNGLNIADTVLFWVSHKDSDGIFNTMSRSNVGGPQKFSHTLKI